MKKALTTVLAIGMSAIWGLAAAEAQPTKRYDPGTQTCRKLTFQNLRTGYHLFRENCKTCHSRDKDQGGDFLYTESYSMKGWNRVFARRYPDCAREGSWKKLSQEELQEINDYLYANAWDASNPHCYV